MFAKSVILLAAIVMICTLVGLTARAADSAPSLSASTIFYVEYTQYARYPDGKTKRVGGGTEGPFFTRREAQSTCDSYLGKDYYVGKVRYYYAACVTSRQSSVSASLYTPPLNPRSVQRSC
jgi:hypothetical protein